MANFRDKVILVTGASSGIGREATLQLAKRGAHIALASRTVSALEEVAHEVERLGVRALVVPTDVAQREQCDAAVDKTVEHFGKLDVLLCSAGVSMRSSFDKTTPEALDRVMQINFYGTMHPSYRAIPHLKKSKGSLVAVSSISGRRATPSFAIYAASKFAVQGLYESLRMELKRDGVHVGIFSPGFVDTPLREKVLGPDGEPWAEPLPLPFRVWPVEKAVKSLVSLIDKRKPEAVFPWFFRPFLAMDVLTKSYIGDRFLCYKFGLSGKEPPGPPFS